MSRYVTRPLLTPYEMAGLTLSNRVVMAPMTRARATNAELVPTELHVQYYGQRASAGLIVSEGVWISRDAIGYRDVPGLFSDAQVQAWSRVTDAVHAAEGRIFAQLWHTGATSHPDFFGGTAPLAPSAIDPGLHARTAGGTKPTVVPRAMTRADIAATIADYAAAAGNAMRAGFDGVQLQAGFNYLISQFLNPATNLRTDAYGGTMAKRARLLFEVLDAIGEEVDLTRVGVKAGPAWSEHGAFRSTAETLDTSDYVIARLNDHPLSHLLLMTTMAESTDRAITQSSTDPTLAQLSTDSKLARLEGRGMYDYYRPRYDGTLIANVGISPRVGDALIGERVTDLVAFGAAYIANPDLTERLATGARLAVPDRATTYTAGAVGYTDYPTAS